MFGVMRPELFVVHQNLDGKFRYQLIGQARDDGQGVSRNTCNSIMHILLSEASRNHGQYLERPQDLGARQVSPL